MTTSTAPVEAGTTYPLPPAPAWAAETAVEEEAIGHYREIASGTLPPASSWDVGVSRFDLILPRAVVVGSTYVHAFDLDIPPADARKIAAALVEAADVIEGA